MASTSIQSVSDPNNDKTLLELLDAVYLDTTPAVDEGICKNISLKIKKKEVSLAIVVEELGPRLTSTHVQERSKAVGILAQVFANLPNDFMNEKELSFVVDFLCDRCRDQHIVIPKIILCVFPIVKSKNLPKGSGTKLLDHLFREANIQSHIHKIRHTFFKTLQFLLSNKLDEIQNMSTDFIMNFLQSMDGEKDPRNLLLLFRIIPRIVSNFELGPFIEDFFEILSCYFPVDFNPTVLVPGEELITRKDLANALQVCLSQTNEFAEFLLPLIMEKLESSSVDAKIDSLELLKLCCERSYLPQDLEPFLAQLWHVMRKEIFMGGNEEVEKKCYEFLKAAFQMISKDDSILDKCLTMIFSECKHHLSEPELRLIMPTSNILRCITESGEAACISVVKMVFPILYDQTCVKPSKSEKKRLLEIWETLLRTCRQYTDVKLHAIVPNWDEMRGLWFTLLTDSDWELVMIVLRIFSSAIVLCDDFEQQHRNMLQEHLLRLIRSCFTMPLDARSAVILLSKRLCYYYGEEFSNVCVPRFLNTLSHSTSATTDDILCENKCEKEANCEIKSLSCKVLGECSHLHQVTFQKVVTYLLEKLETNVLDLTYINCLSNIVEKAFASEEDDYTKTDLLPLFSSMNILDKVISEALKICDILKMQQDQPITDASGSELAVKVPMINNKFSSWESFSQAANIVRKILRAYKEPDQAKVVKRYWEDQVKEECNIERQLSDIPGLLIEALLGPIKPNVNIFMRKSLMKCLMAKTLISSNPFASHAMEFHIMPNIRLLSSLINKVQDEKELNEYLNEVENFMERGLGLIANDTNTLANQEQKEKMETDEQSAGSLQRWAKINLIYALVFIVKGLAMQGYSELDLWLEKVIKLLADEDLGEEVVSCFHLLVADDPYTLNPESFCRFRFLYKQRLFLMTVEKLVSGYRSSTSQAAQFSFIRALSCQLKHVPSEILFMEIDSVLPLLVASLKCNSSSQVILSTLNALTDMMNSPDTKHKLTDYNHDLVPQLARLAQYKDCMNVRRVSLICLRKCAKAPAHVILPLRDTVTDNLGVCLDDPKRLVRKEAILTRNIWLLIGAPGGL